MFCPERLSRRLSGWQRIKLWWRWKVRFHWLVQKFFPLKVTIPIIKKRYPKLEVKDIIAHSMKDDVDHELFKYKYKKE